VSHDHCGSNGYYLWLIISSVPVPHW